MSRRRKTLRNSCQAFIRYCGHILGYELPLVRDAHWLVDSAYWFCRIFGETVKLAWLVKSILWFLTLVS